MNCPKCRAENSPQALFCSRCGSQLPQPDDPPSLGQMPTHREPRTRRFKTGDVILGRYRVSGELGQGGMGVVYRCFDDIGGIEVALKALPPELSHNSIEMEEVRENFRIVEKLHHPNIAAVKTLERDPATGDYYLILESVEGADLRRWRKQRGGKVSLDDALPLLRQVAAALDYAHTEKIIHRDIKPSNVMVRPDGTVKVLDFGLAAQIQSSLARVSQVKYGTSGTGPYMAPEQWRGQYQDAATDQYALAVMAYELLSGRLPFDSPDPTVLQQAILNTAAEPPAGLPPGGWPSLARALAKHRGERFGHCAAFVQALAGSNPGEGAGDKAENRTAKAEANPKAEIRKPESHKPLAMGLALAVVLLLGLGGWYFGLHVPEQRRKTELARSTGSLRMGSTPEGAEFTLESNGDVFDQVESGTRRGTTPAELSSLPTGEYRYVVKRGDWEQRGTVMVERNATAEARVEFDYGSVRLTSEPSGATVVQGSRTLGQTPLTLTEQRPGSVSYTLSLPKHKPASVSGTVEAKRELALAARLENAAYPTLEQPYENTLGMKFVPVAGTEVLFCAWETRVRDYAAYAQANQGVDGSWRNPVYEGRPVTPQEDCPVVAVSWNDAKAFCEWLTRKERAEGKIGPEQSYRLPADWEWSVAVGLNEGRGGTPKSKDEQIKDVYPWGTGWPPPQGAGNYDARLGVDSYERTAPVGSFAANRYGLYDLGGNVWEWCEDWYDTDEKYRVLRGGSWDGCGARGLLSSIRIYFPPYFLSYSVGFRCVLVCGSAPR